MLNIKDLRQKYPQYNDLSDTDIADRLHAKYYSDMPKENFYSKIGLKNNFLHAVANSAPVNATLGARDAIVNDVTDLLNLGIGAPLPGKLQLPQTKSSEGLSYDVGNLLGQIGAFGVGGEGLAATRAASEGLPIVGQLAKSLAGKGARGIARRASGAALGGAVLSPDDRTAGAVESGALSTALDSIPYIGKGISKTADYFSADKIALQMLKKLGGLKSLDENAENFASNLMNTYQDKAAAVRNIFKPIHERAGKNFIAETVNANPSKLSDDQIRDTLKNGKVDLKNKRLHIPEINPTNENNYKLEGELGEYFKYSPNESSKEFRDVIDTRNKFIKEPTFNNARELQKEIGQKIGKLKYKSDKAEATIKEINLLKKYGKQYDVLDQHIRGFLGKNHPDLLPEYERGISEYKNNVLKYHKDPNILKIVKGKIKNPHDIISTFKSPEPHTQAIVNDLGAKGKNAIIYDFIGGVRKNPTAENLLSAFKGIDSARIGKYVEPEIANLESSLAKKLKQRNMAQKIGLATLGVLGGKLLTGGLGGEALGGLLGAKAAPELNDLLPGASMSNFINKDKPIDKVIEKFGSNKAKKTADLVRNALLAASIGTK